MPALSLKKPLSTAVLNKLDEHILKIGKKYEDERYGDMASYANTPEKRRGYFYSMLGLLQGQVLDGSAHQFAYQFISEVLESDPEFKEYFEDFRANLTEPLHQTDSLAGTPIAFFNILQSKIDLILSTKTKYPDLNFKHILAVTLLDFLNNQSIATRDPLIQNALKSANKLLQEKQYERLYSVINDLCAYLHSVDSICKNKDIQPIITALNRHSQQSLRPDTILLSHQEKRALKENLSTPPAILTLLKQGGFQTMGTRYCSVISVLVNTYISINHLTALHAKEGLTPEKLSNEFMRLVGVDPASFSGADPAQNMINAFYASQFYRDKLPSKTADNVTIRGPINFADGESFNTNILDNRPGGHYSDSGVIEIASFITFLNMAAFNLLQDNSDHLFKVIVEPISGTEYSEPCKLNTVINIHGKWAGVPHVAIKVPEGTINAPKSKDYWKTNTTPGAKTQFMFEAVRIGKKTQEHTLAQSSPARKTPTAPLKTQNQVEPPVESTPKEPLKTQNQDVPPVESKPIELVTQSGSIPEETSPITKTKEDLNFRIKTAKLLDLCEHYKQHLDQERNRSDEIAQDKLGIVEQLIDKLQPQNLTSNTLIDLSKILNDDNQALLKTRRDSSAGAHFLETFLNILSLGIYSKLSKGSFSFWKSHGEVFNETFTENLTDTDNMKKK